MNTNLYDTATVQVSGRPSPWRIVPAVFFLLFGIAVSGSIAFLIVSMLMVIIPERIPLPAVHVFIGAGVWFLCGIGFIVASIYFWLAKYRRAAYTILAAIAIYASYAIAANIFGWL